MDFYDRALASNSFPDDWVQDEEGIWQERAVTLPPDPGHSRTSRTTPSSYTSLSDLRAAFNRRGIYNDTNPTSVSSIVTQHDLDADRDADNPRTPESGDTDSGRGTPRQQPPCRTQTLAGIGDGIMNERAPRRRPTRLEETSDKYGRSFVEYKERSATEKLEAAKNGRVSDSASYQLAVHTHDDLSSSNGPERITEERVAVCALINTSNHAGENCNICYRPPDYYDTAGTYAATEEESIMPATDVEWLHRSGGGDIVNDRFV